MQDLNVVVSRLKESIERSGLSYVELERRTNVAKSSIQRYASGATKKIPIDAIQAIAKAVNVSSAYILGWTDNDSPINENVPASAGTKIQSLIEMYEKLSPRNQALLESLLESMLAQQEKDE